MPWRDIWFASIINPMIKKWIIRSASVVAERFSLHAYLCPNPNCISSSQTKKGQYGQNNHHQTHQINNWIDNLSPAICCFNSCEVATSQIEFGSQHHPLIECAKWPAHLMEASTNTAMKKAASQHSHWDAALKKYFSLAARIIWMLMGHLGRLGAFFSGFFTWWSIVAAVMISRLFVGAVWLGLVLWRFLMTLFHNILLFVGTRTSSKVKRIEQKNCSKAQFAF